MDMIKLPTAFSKYVLKLNMYIKAKTTKSAWNIFDTSLNYGSGKQSHGSRDN